MLTDARIIELIEAYGTDPDAWPASEQDGGRAALAAPSEAVQRVLDEFAGLDALLAEVTPIEAPSHLVSSILEKAPDRKEVPAQSSNWLAGLLGPKWAAQVSAGVASLVLGLGIGLGTATAEPDSSFDDAAIYSALGVSSLADDFDGGTE